MERFHSSLRFKSTWVCLLAILTPLALTANTALAITASIGRPYQGKLKNGIPFPREFSGYQLRGEEVTYTTPELVGSLLDAIEGVRERYPDTCDLYLGDFSREGGGWLNRHRSHQNGRDVDLGMYAKDNRQLDCLVPMNEANLDVPKTWQLVENLLRSQKIQYIFVDRNIQRLLYDYAASHGNDQAYLDRLFGNSRGAVIQHVRGHQDHMHVRFFTPWSSLAGRMEEIDGQKATIIEIAQQSFLPKKVNYYVKSGESDVRALARSFGVTTQDLCRWNQLRGSSVLNPGSCLVFYKRGFELEPVHLAQTLQPDPSLDNAPVQVASISPRILRDLSAARFAERRRQSQQPSDDVSSVQSAKYKVRKGETLQQIAKRYDISVETLSRLNGLKPNARVKAGQDLKIEQKVAVSRPSGASVEKIPQPSVPAAYTVRRGDTLEQIAKKYGMDASTFRQLNGLKNNATVRPGQKLKTVTAQPPKETCEVSKPASKQKQTPSASRQTVSSQKQKSDAPRQAAPLNQKKAPVITREAPASKKTSDAARQTVTPKKVSDASRQAPARAKPDAAKGKKVAADGSAKTAKVSTSTAKKVQPMLRLSAN